MTGLAIGLAILGFFVLVDVLAWNALCRAIERMELTEDEAAVRTTAEASSGPSWPLRRAYGTKVTRHTRTGDQG